MLNTAILQGRITAEPELKHTQSGIAVCSFTLAVDGGYGEHKRTDFINITCWRNTAEFVTKYLHKGAMIVVKGSIQTRKYEDKNGNKRTAFEVVADEVNFCESKKQAAENSMDEIEQNAKNAGASTDFVEIDGDDDS